MVQCPPESNGYSGPFITRMWKARTVSMMEHWYPPPPIAHKHIPSAGHLCDLRRSVFSLPNNWDWYNLSQEQILNQQHGQHTVHKAPWLYPSACRLVTNCPQHKLLTSQLRIYFKLETVCHDTACAAALPSIFNYKWEGATFLYSFTPALSLTCRPPEPHFWHVPSSEHYSYSVTLSAS